MHTKLHFVDIFVLGSLSQCYWWYCYSDEWLMHCGFFLIGHRQSTSTY